MVTAPKPGVRRSERSTNEAGTPRAAGASWAKDASAVTRWMSDDPATTTPGEKASAALGDSQYRIRGLAVR